MEFCLSLFELEKMDVEGREKKRRRRVYILPGRSWASHIRQPEACFKVQRQERGGAHRLPMRSV
jgi:hypothetical protein